MFIIICILWNGEENFEEQNNRLVYLNHLLAPKEYGGWYTKALLNLTTWPIGIYIPINWKGRQLHDAINAIAPINIVRSWFLSKSKYTERKW